MKMAYFLPSFFQKRLLKYALSRLGIVDTEALDPDNLGIRWGQRSTVELRDIGLKLEVSVAGAPRGMRLDLLIPIETREGHADIWTSEYRN